MSRNDPSPHRPRPARPVAPPTPAPAQAPQRADDDTAIVPPPDSSVFAAGYRTRAAARLRHSGIFVRQTMIPILLTCGVMLPMLAALWFRLDDDSALRLGAGRWLPITLTCVGAVMLVLAVLNMLQVRHLLRTPLAQQQPRRRSR